MKRWSSFGIALVAAGISLTLLAWVFSSIYRPLSDGQPAVDGGGDVVAFQAREACTEIHKTLDDLEKEAAENSSCSSNADCQFIGCGLSVSKTALASVAIEMSKLQNNWKSLDCGVRGLCDFDLGDPYPVCSNGVCFHERPSSLKDMEALAMPPDSPIHDGT